MWDGNPFLYEAMTVQSDVALESDESSFSLKKPVGRRSRSDAFEDMKKGLPLRILLVLPLDDE